MPGGGAQASDEEGGTQFKKALAQDLKVVADESKRWEWKSGPNLKET